MIKSNYAIIHNNLEISDDKYRIEKKSQEYRTPKA